MSPLRNRRFVFVTAAVMVAVLLAVYFVPFHRARGSSSSDCRTLSVAARVPSVAMDHERGVAYLSYIDVPKQPSGRAARGTIMLMDLNVAEPRVRAALVTDPPDFQPGALSIDAPEQGPRRLFVVDHENEALVFEQSPSGAFEQVKATRDAKSVRASALGDGPNLNRKVRKTLEVIERDDTTDLQVCPAPAVTPSS